MRILVLGINYWPEKTGIAPFTTGRCEYLAALGHQVIVCTSLPYYPEWRIATAYRRRLLVREERNDVTILRSRIYVPKRINSLRRVLHESSFVAASLLRSLVQQRPDVILAVSPPLGLTIPALILSRRWGIPYVLHVADLQPDAAVELGMLPTGLLVRSLYALERLAYRNASLISTLTESMRQRIISKQIAAHKVKLFPDWAAPEFFRITPNNKNAGFSRGNGVHKDCLVLHAGNMGQKQGLEVMLGAAELSRQDSQIEYLLVGDGAARKSLQHQAVSRALSNVQFLPLQTQSAFINLLASADISVITQQRAVTDIVFPSKTLTFMAAGLPLIASVNSTSEVAKVITQTHAGLVVEPGNPAALLAAIELLRRRSDERLAMGMRAREYARSRWDRGQILADTAKQLESLVNSSMGREQALAGALIH